MLNDPEKKDPEPGPEPEPTPTPAPTPVKETIEPHKVEDPLERVINLITANQTETNNRFALLESRLPSEKGKDQDDTPQGKQEQTPTQPDQKPAGEPKPGGSRPRARNKIRLWRTL